MDRKDNKKELSVGEISAQLGKLPPQAVDLEEAVLGALMLERDALVSVLDILKPEAFYKEQNMEIYQAIIDLYMNSEPVDLLTVTSKLRKKGKLEIAGGSFYVTNLTTRVNSAANIEAHARIIVEASMKRDIIQMASSMQRDAYDAMVDVFDLLEEVERGLFATQAPTVKKNISKIGDALFRRVKQLEQVSTTSNGLIGVPSGFTALDRITGGFHPGNLIIIAARPAMGKAQPFFSKVLTKNGFKLMGEIETGDLVSGPDGKFYPISGVFNQGIREIYKVTFDDGAFTYSCKEHLWKVQSRSDRRKNKPASVISLDEIAQSLRVGSDNRLNYSIPYTLPIEFGKKFLPIHPYLLGALLGDGKLGSGTIMVMNPEHDIIDMMRSVLPEGDELNQCSDRKDHYRIINKNKSVAGSLTSLYLEAMDLKGRRSAEKFIPYSYLHSSITDRIWLLRGLLDTDGYSQHGICNVEYSTVSPQLKDDIIFLIQGLGGHATYKKYQGAYRKNGEKFTTKEYYRINLYIPDHLVPFNSRKNLKKLSVRKRPFKRFIKSVRKAGNYECRCIMVDSDEHLYLTDDFIITHNSAYVTSVLRNVAVDFNIPCAIFSLEMSESEIIDRLISSESEINLSLVRKGFKDNPEMLSTVFNKIAQLEKSPLFIDDSPEMSILDIRAKSRRLVQKHGVRLIVVDYLQLMRGHRKSNGNREQEIAEISRGLKALAKELNVPVIALSQLSRAVETRGGDKRPILSDIRESGSIEADADVVGFLYRAEYYGITQDASGMPTAGIGEIIIAKNRQGAIDNVLLRFIGQYTKWCDLNDFVPQLPQGNFRPLPPDPRLPYREKDDEDTPPF